MDARYLNKLGLFQYSINIASRICDGKSVYEFSKDAMAVKEAVLDVLSAAAFLRHIKVGFLDIGKLEKDGGLLIGADKPFDHESLKQGILSIASDFVFKKTKSQKINFEDKLINCVTILTEPRPIEEGLKGSREEVGAEIESRVRFNRGFSEHIGKLMESLSIFHGINPTIIGIHEQKESAAVSRFILVMDQASHRRLSLNECPGRDEPLRS